MKKVFAVILVLCMFVGFAACGEENSAIPLGDTGVWIVFPEDVGFERFESERNDFFGGNPGGIWCMIVNGELKSDYPGYTLADYADGSAQVNEGELAQDIDGNYFFTYTNEYSADEIYKFYTAVRENAEQYYRISFYCFDSDWEEYGPKFADWARTIVME